MHIPPTKVVFDRPARREILSRVEDILKTGLLSQGRNVEEFEREWARVTGSRHAVAVNSGSSAIEVSMRILGIKGREVLVPVNTFAATAVSVLMAGGNVRFVDIDPETFSISLKNLKRRVTSRTRGVVIVHIAGIISPEINLIRSWCSRNGLWLFEDCAHAHGSELRGRHAGTFGIAGGYSFFATKVITSGEGGMIVTNSRAFADHARLLRNHGKPEPWVSYHTDIGSNWRMSELHAAVGLAHLKRLDRSIARREKLAGIYTKLLGGIPGLVPVLPASKCSWYKYIVLLPGGVDRKALKDSLREKGVNLPGEVYDLPLHRQPVFKGNASGIFPAAEDVCSRHICLPLYDGMTEKEAAFVAANLRNAFIHRNRRGKL